jgi:1,4-alpha-glucan branching enzyme
VNGILTRVWIGICWNILFIKVYRTCERSQPLYRSESAFYENQFDKTVWMDRSRWSGKFVYVYLRKGKKEMIFWWLFWIYSKSIDYKIGIPAGTHWEVFLIQMMSSMRKRGNSEILEEKYEEWRGI